MKNNINNINNSISNVLGQLKGKINPDFIKDLDGFFNNVVKCLEKKSDLYNKCIKKGMSAQEAKREEWDIWKREVHYKLDGNGYAGSYKSKPREEIIFAEELKECIDREILKNGLPGDLNDTFYKPSICGKTVIVHARGSWKFPNTNFSQNLISWWLHCFKQNKNTAIISESWDPPKFNIFKNRFIQTYISGGPHEVVFLIYDEVDGFTLKFPQ